MSPSSFIPTVPTDFIGPAGKQAALRFFQAGKLRGTREGSLRLVLHGPPGTAKTRLAEALALHLCGSPKGIVHGTVHVVNGQSLSIDLLRDWTRSSQFYPMSTEDNPTPRTVYLVDECDAMSPAALNEWRTFSDRLKPGRDIILTTNRELKELQAQLQTRAMAAHIGAPTEQEIAAFLFAKFAVAPAAATELARASGGCVRAALLDAQNHLDALEMEASS